MGSERCIRDSENAGSLTDPEATTSEIRRDKEKHFYLNPTEELFLLALRAEDPARPNRDYITQLALYYGTSVSLSFISLWFKTRFDYKGSFRKPNLVPLDKFRQENVIRFVESKLKCSLLTDKSRFRFIDKTPPVHLNTVPNTLTRCPLS